MGFGSELIFAAIIVFVAYLVRGIAGFGSALISIPLLTLHFPLVVVVPLVVLLDYVGSLGQGFHSREAIAWRDLLPLLPFTFIGAAAALWLFDTLDPITLSRLLGVFVILFSIYQLLPTPQIHASRTSAIPYGFLGGLMGTLFGTGGPFYVIYLTVRGLEKTVFRASFATYFAIDGTARIIGYGLLGFLSAQMWELFALALPVALVGLLVGGRMHVSISQVSFKRLISALLLASGTALLLK
ncbi:MAG: sulfite exporter TauE/SafE family protein [Pseudomonadota bacterium]